MQEELNQFSGNDVWDLVPKPKVTHVIGTKWVFKNKLNKKEVVRNKTRWLHKAIVARRDLLYRNFCTSCHVIVYWSLNFVWC